MNEAVQAAWQAVKAELEPLYKKRDAIEAERVANEGEIAKREAFLKEAAMLLGQTKELQPFITGATAVKPPEPVPNVALLANVARSGYGSVTNGVAALLAADPHGYSARTLTEALHKAGFHLNGPDPEMAIRSALKNLRNQGRIVYDSESGRYRLAQKRPPIAIRGPFAGGTTDSTEGR